jgi:hypothetical protein
MVSLANANPQGRLDVLVFRLVERIGRQHIPAEWPVFRPFVERWARSKFGPRKRGARQ